MYLPVESFPENRAVSFGFDVVRVGSGPLGLIFHITALLAHLK